LGTLWTQATTKQIPCRLEKWKDVRPAGRNGMPAENRPRNTFPPPGLPAAIDESGQ